MSTLYKYGLVVFILQVIGTASFYLFLDGMGRMIVVLLLAVSFYQLLKLRQVMQSGNDSFL